MIKELALSVERSWVYYSTLMLAGLVALLGLLTDSVAVVIGAMLISPLMGPIISSSLAFTIGDLALARRAFRTIATSVALTIAVSALVTLLSPLKEPTGEILARVRPNIYDLLIAVCCGVVGAIALCTKRNYLITSTGVAVATAVIPPLSVTGYALGTGQPKLALGGFLLFFTNFVAIVLASDLVFFILGFRSTFAETPLYSRRTRYLVVAGLLTLISVPLIHTLASDLSRLKERKRVERVLKRHLDRDRSSRLAGYEQRPEGAGTLIRATAYTVRPIERREEQLMERELAAALGRPVSIRLEQLMVASDRELTPPRPQELFADAAPPRAESAAQLGEKLAPVLARVQQELSQALAPFPLSDLRLSFAPAGHPLLVSARLRRDYPVSQDESLLLCRQLERFLGLPVQLALDRAPLLPQLSLDRAGRPSTDSARELEIVKLLPEGAGSFRFQIACPKGERRQAQALRRYLCRELAVPEQRLALIELPGRHPPGGGVTLRILRR